jgi:hypothetical protein
MENICHKMVCCYNNILYIKTFRICNMYKARRGQSRNIFTYWDESNVGVLFNISVSVHIKVRKIYTL